MAPKKGRRLNTDEMKTRLTTTLAVTFCFVILGTYTFTALAQEAPKITREKVLRMLDNPDVIIIDVRSSGAELKIKGAVKEDPENVSLWIDKYPKEKTLVFY